MIKFFMTVGLMLMSVNAQPVNWIPSKSWTAKSAKEQWISATDSRVFWGGRVWQDKGSVVFDWPGIYVQCKVESAAWSVVIEGENLFDVWVDGEWVGVIHAQSTPMRFDLKWPESASRSIRLGKRTESQTSTSKILGFVIPPKASFLEVPRRTPERRVEFIGDSYTVGFGNESRVQEPPPGQEDSLLLHTTNTNKSFGVLVAKRLGAEYQINGFSGRGLVRNFNGINPGLEYPFFYNHTLVSEAQNPSGVARPWDLKAWHPQVIVIAMGINDFQGDPPYADSAQWISTYRKLISQLRTAHAGVRFVLCATAIHPNNDLIEKVKTVVSLEQNSGQNDVEYFEYGAEKTGLWWHPSVEDHQAIAQALIPVVTKAGGWLRR